MTPLWRLRSGRFVGWRTRDGQLYNAAGKHIGYMVREIAYTNDGHAIGELYGERRLGRRKTVIYPAGRRQASQSAKASAGLTDTTGIPLAGWTDPEL